MKHPGAETNSAPLELFDFWYELWVATRWVKCGLETAGCRHLNEFSLGTEYKHTLVHLEVLMNT